MKHLRKFNEELGPKTAARGLKAVPDHHPLSSTRTKKIRRDIYTNLFKEYIKKDIGLMAKTSEREPVYKYRLEDVFPAESDKEQNLILIFSLDPVEKTASPNAGVRESYEGKSFFMEYDPESDKYVRNAPIGGYNRINNGENYHFNARMINFLIKAANIWRRTYYEYNPDNIDKWIKVKMDNEGTKKGWTIRTALDNDPTLKLSLLKKSDFISF